MSLVHLDPGEIEFQIGASGYSGLAVSSPIYVINCVAPEPSESPGQPLDILPFLIGSIGLVSVVIVVIYIVRLKKAP